MVGGRTVRARGGFPGARQTEDAMDLEATVAELAERLAAVERRAQAAVDHLAIANLQRAYGYYVD